MVQEVEITEVEIDGRTFWMRPVGHNVLRSGNVVATALAESLDRSYSSVVGFLFGNKRDGHTPIMSSVTRVQFSAAHHR